MQAAVQADETRWLERWSSQRRIFWDATLKITGRAARMHALKRAHSGDVRVRVPVPHPFFAIILFSFFPR